VLVFAVSVFFLTHPPLPDAAPESARTAAGLSLPQRWESLNGPVLAAELRPLLNSLGVHGEIDFIRRAPARRRLIVPVLLPGVETTVDLNFASGEAVITRRTTGLAAALVHLHKMPGPHNAALRGNSPSLRIWKVLADVSAYGILFLLVTGVYLWLVVRAERRAGLIAFACGAFSFFGLVYVLTR
jgi:hypothetical protein